MQLGYYHFYLVEYTRLGRGVKGFVKPLLLAA